MNVAELLDELDNMIDEAWNLPLSGGKTVIDADKMKDILYDIKDNFPQEIIQARAIVSDRNKILNEAKEEAKKIIENAEKRAKLLVGRDEISKRAQNDAVEIVSSANEKSKEIRKAANDYVNDLMKRAEEQLSMNLAEVKSARQNLKTTFRQKNK